MRGFSSLQLGIECKHSLLSRAASVAVFQAAQAGCFWRAFAALIVKQKVNFVFYSLAQAGCLWRAFAALIVKQKSKLYVLFACISLELHLFIHPQKFG